MQTIALILISTGDRYWQYIQPMIDSAKYFFPKHEVVLFTDSEKNFGVKTFKKQAQGFPNETLLRYHTILTQKDYLSAFDYIFYVDVDMLFVNDVCSCDLLGDGLTATLHPGFAHGQTPPLETNPLSTAYISNVSHYFCGGFNGGKSSEFLKLAETCKTRIDADLSKGIIARWHDESHLNKYLAEHPPSKILSPSFCYPETNVKYYEALWGGPRYKPVLLALTKNKRQQQTQLPVVLTSGNKQDRFISLNNRIKIL